MHFLGSDIIRTNVYIDGFNLYYGCLKGSPHKWLNLEKLFDALLPENTVQTIHYFTARVEARPNDIELPVRQATYLRALATLPRVRIHFGSFMTSTARAPVVECQPDGKPRMQNNRPVLKLRPNGGVLMEMVQKVEEKGSDVNLAANLLSDAFQKRCECAVVVSNDSDLLTPIRMAKEECRTTVGLVLPRDKGSAQLRRLSDFQKPMRTHHLVDAQFEKRLADSAGTITKPGSWR